MYNCAQATGVNLTHNCLRTRPVTKCLHCAHQDVSSMVLECTTRLTRFSTRPGVDATASRLHHSLCIPTACEVNIPFYCWKLDNINRNNIFHGTECLLFLFRVILTYHVKRKLQINSPVNKCRISLAFDTPQTQRHY